MIMLAPLAITGVLSTTRSVNPFGTPRDNHSLLACRPEKVNATSR